MKRMTKTDWLKTPYARSESRTDSQLMALLERYKITTHQITNHLGPNGRPAITLRFIFRGKAYRISGEVMDVDRAEPSALIHQTKRWIHWYLKCLLELVGFFGPAEQLLLGFLESGDGTTVYQAIQPHLAQMPAPAQLLAIARKELRALPAPPIEGVEV